MKAASGLRRQAVLASAHNTRPHSAATVSGAARVARLSRDTYPRHSFTNVSIRAYSTTPEVDAARTHKGDAVEELEVEDEKMSEAAEVHEDARSSPMKEYHRLVDRGVLRADDYQVKIVQKLQDLHDELVNYTPTTPKSPSSDGGLGLLSRFFHSSSAPAPSKPPLGLYLYGDVGTGKTMLMDLFFKTLPPNVKKKRRVHFHAFMIDVHKRIHAMKRRLGPDGGDPIAPVGRELAKDARVLCFDEFQVTDIADAMVLRRLLETLLHDGVVMVITSNRHPDQLYRNGINRDSFIPAIDLLKTDFSVTDLDSGTDYRRIPRSLSNVYYSPLDDSTRSEIHKLFEGLTRDQKVIEGRTLDIWGRKLSVPKSSEHVAMFDFDSLCGKPLSAADYIEITKSFGTVFLVDVKKMGLGEKDKARRFITFIDACYESKTKLFVSSEVPIYQIFADDNGGKGSVSDHMRSVMDDLGLSADIVGGSSMFSGEEEIFAFARCCSRLVQMGSKEWAETAGHAGH